MSNQPAQEMYRRFGFSAVGIRKGYYAETNEDALVMWARRHRHPGAHGAPRRGRAWHRRRDHLRAVAALAVTAVLGIETSCDETAAAVVDDGHDIRSSVVSSQVDLHARFGGVVPEIASRAHAELVSGVVAEALVEAGAGFDDIDAVAACHGPGLAGALLVGVSAAKALALTLDVPYVGVNHLEAHLHAAWLEDPDVELPLAVLIVSGGHTMVVIVEGDARYRLLGQTVDDAAGEAFDKVARYLGLGYPGGPIIDRLAQRGRPARDRRSRDRCATTDSTSPSPASRPRSSTPCAAIPRPRCAISRRRSRRRSSTCWSRSCVAAADAAGARTLVIGGGVAANSRLRGPGAGGGGGIGRPGAAPAPRALHRQRGDDRGDRLVAAPLRRPHLAGVGAYPSLRLPTRD